MHKPQAPPLILASSSPRRQQLLAEAGYEFEVVCPGVNEGDFARDVPPRGYAERLALVKAKDVAVKFADALVVGADTVVDFDGEIIGKAANAKEAEQITRKLFSRPHKVITAVAVVRLSDGVEIVESDTTTVLPKPMTDEQIAEHIKTGSWRGKAGAYAIKEKGDEFVERIEGSLTNVMGLPTELLKRLLEKLIG